MMNFKDIEWGKDESRGDINLAQYFVKIPAMESITSGKYRYIIGRKGSGKTAIAEKIRIDAESKHNWFCEDVSLKDFPVNDFRELGDSKYRDKSKFVEAWKFVICMALVSLLKKDMSCEQQEAMLRLNDFVERNFPGNDIGVTHCITTLTENKLKVALKYLEYNGGKSESVTTNVHFSKATKKLLDDIKCIRTDSVYYLFFDELDEGYNAKDTSLRLILLALLRAIEVLSLELGSSTISFRPLLMLRADIYNRLHDNDLNKLDDYIVRLDWSEFSGSQCKLIDIANARIVASLGSNINWTDVVSDKDRELPRKVETVWKYIINRTYERPRDVIKFLKYCKQECNTGILKFRDVKLAENRYSSWLFNELKDEMCAHLPCYVEAVMSLSTLGRTIFDYSQCTDALLDDIVVSKYCEDNAISADEIVKLLFDFSVIGTVDTSDRWIFKYKDNDLPFKKGTKLMLHYGLVRKLRARTKPH